MSKHAVLAFKLDYGEECPLWYSTGGADLDSLQLPPDLTERLRRWSTYWPPMCHGTETGQKAIRKRGG